VKLKNGEHGWQIAGIQHLANGNRLNPVTAYYTDRDMAEHHAKVVINMEPGRRSTL